MDSNDYTRYNFRTIFAFLSSKLKKPYLPLQISHGSQTS